MAIIACTNESVPSHEELNLLRKLVSDSLLEGEEIDLALWKIDNCTDYKDYQSLQFWLESIKKPFDLIVNPNAGDIKKHLKSWI